MLRNYHTTKFIGFVLIITLIVFTGTLSPAQASDSLTEVNGDNLVVGDVVAQGLRVSDNECEFDTFKVRTTAPEGNGETKWLAVGLNKRCQAIVTAKWRGHLEDGPAQVVEPLFSLLPTASSAPRVPVTIEEQPPTETTETSLQSSGTKTSEQHVYMYGYGGPSDKLTHLQAYITFSYDGTNATITDEAGWCQGSQPFSSYEWVVDDCWGTVYRGPDTRVYFESNGEYHCDPPGTFPCNGSNPDGYYHTLIAEEDGHGDGRSHCTFGYSGHIVEGVGRTVLQGCS